MWEHVTHALDAWASPNPNVGGSKGGTGQMAPLLIMVQKITLEDNPEAYLNAFECTATMARWVEAQWAALLIPSYQTMRQAVNTLPISDLNNYQKLCGAILQSLNMSPEVYQRRLREIKFGPDYHPCLIGQKIRVVCSQCSHPETQSKEQIVEAIMVEH